MSKLTQLRERKAKIAQQARAKIEGLADDATDEVRTAVNTEVDAMFADVDKIDAEIRQLENLESIESSLTEVAEQRAGREDTSTDEARENNDAEERAFWNMMRSTEPGLTGLSDEERAIVRAMYTRAQATGTDTAGGFLIPENFVRRLEEAKKAFGGIRTIAQVIRTENGSPLTMPTADNTAEEGAILAENTAGAEDDFAFGQEQMGTFMYHSGIVRVPYQLLEDSFFDLESYLPMQLTRRIARKENADYANGNGTTAPQGFLTAAPSLATAGVGAIVWDDMIDLEHSVDPEYRMNGAYALSDAALQVIRKLKDADGRPLWQPSTREGAPATINGKRYVIVQEMPTVATGNSPIAFGDFNQFIVRDAGTPIVQRLQERYAEFLQVGFHNAERHGSHLLTAGGAPIRKLTVA